MKNFYAWITLLTKEYYPPLVAALLERKFTVSPLAAGGTITWVCDGSVLVAINLSIDTTFEGDRNLDAAKVNDEVAGALKDMKAQYHSLVVFQIGGAGATCSWHGGNIKFPLKIPKEQPLEIRGVKHA